MAPLSGVEAEPNTRLFNLWLETTLAPDTALRVGQFTAGQEFAISSNAALFVNATFGWPNILAQDLPSGGPSFPIGALGLRLAHKTTNGSILLAVFNGDPAGPGDDDPQRRDRFGLNSLKLSGEPFVIAERQFAWPSRGAELRVGAWWLGRPTPAAPLGPVGGGPVGGGAAATKRGNVGGYAILDATLAHRGAATLAGFLRLAAAPADRNLISAYADAGLTVSGFADRRPHDQIGLAVAISRVGAAARSLDAQAIAAGELAIRRDQEIAVELTYQAEVTPHWWLQPDLQWVGHPGGHVPLPGAPGRAIPDALVLGLRNRLSF